MQRKHENIEELMRTVIVFLAAVFCFITPVYADDELKLAVTDISGLEALQRDFGAFQKVLNEKSGLKLTLFPVTSRTAVVEGLRSKRIDLVLSGPGEYIVAKKKTDVRPVVGLLRPDYFSAIIVKSDSPIYSVADLKGKKIALGDVGSTSYYLSPIQILAGYGIDARKEMKIMSVSKQIGWEALKRGQVDAIGMNHERFRLLRDQDKSASPSDFRVVARGADLPNDVLLAGSHVSEDVVTKLRGTFGTYSDEIIAAILKSERNQKYSGMGFLTDIDDSDFNQVREMYRVAGYEEFGESGKS